MYIRHLRYSLKVMAEQIDRDASKLSSQVGPSYSIQVTQALMFLHTSEPPTAHLDVKPSIITLLHASNKNNTLMVRTDLGEFSYIYAPRVAFYNAYVCALVIIQVFYFGSMNVCRCGQKTTMYF